MDTEKRVFAITRPHQNLMTLYVIRCVLAFPLLPILLPYLFFRYHTLRYRFDREGVGMAWGILFRREVYLTYTRIQDIHLSSGLIQRWLGLADIQVQTASGSAQAEMTIEGLLEHEMVRDYLYQRMRGLREHPHDMAAAAPADAAPAGAAGADGTGGSGGAGASDEAVALLHAIAADVKATRELIESARRSS
jgi:uncharacterized membrane protein YdbT with pleckstrin-like domain